MRNHFPIFLVATLSLWFEGCHDTKKSEAGAKPENSALVSLRYLSRGITIELLSSDGTDLASAARTSSTSISDYPEGTDFETDMMETFAFDSFLFESLATIRVSDAERQLEFPASAFEWENQGAGQFFDFAYQAHYQKAA